MSIKYNADIMAKGTDALIKIAGDNLVASESAIIGNPTTGAIFVTETDRKGLVWIHGVGTEIDSVYTAVSQLKGNDLFYGTPVKVRKSTNGYVVESTDPDISPTFFAGVENRNDQSPVYPNQIMYGNLHPVGDSLQLLVIGAVYNEVFIADQYTPDFSTGTVQDTSSNNIVVPTNNNRSIAVLVQIDAFGVLSYKQSTEFIASISLAQAWRSGFLPTRDDDKYRIGYFKLTCGVTKLTYADISTQFPENGFKLPVADTSAIIKGSDDDTKQVKFEVGGITTATTRTLTVPDADLTLVGTDTTQTLTNKIIDASSNTISNIGASEVEVGLISGLTVENTIDTVNDTMMFFDDSSNTLRQTAIANLLTGGGEINTASNVGVGGVGVYDTKVGVDLQFRNINAGSNKVTVTLDGSNKEIDVDVSEANLTHDNIGGTLGISKGGTGQTNQTSAFDALAPTTTKGDLIANNGTDNVRLPVGTNGHVLKANSATSTGLEWAVESGGMTSFDVQSDDLTSTTITNGETLTIASATNGGISTTTGTNKINIGINGFGLTTGTSMSTSNDYFVIVDRYSAPTPTTRKILVSNLPSLVVASNQSYVRNTGNYTTTSTSFVDVDSTNLALTIVTRGKPVLVGTVGSATNSGAGFGTFFNLMIDGNSVTSEADGIFYLTGTGTSSCSFTYLATGLSATNHTFKLRWRVSAGTGTIYANTIDFKFWVMEIS